MKLYYRGTEIIKNILDKDFFIEDINTMNNIIIKTIQCSPTKNNTNVCRQ